MRAVKALLIALGALALFGVGGVAYEQVARAKAVSRFPVPGRLVDIGGRTLHLDCRGAGSPTVVFESALDAFGSLAWSAVHDSVAAITRACAYDRAGVMWSRSALDDEARDGRAIATDLGRLLDAAGESAPFVLVGHSLGGPYALLFTNARPTDVGGVVLVDASHPDQESRLRGAPGPPLNHARSMARVAQWMAAVGALRLSQAHHRGGVPGFPRDKLAIASAFQPQGMAAVIAETRSITATMAAARTATDLGDRPLVVLTGLRPMTERERTRRKMTEGQATAIRAIWDTLQRAEAGWSSAGRQVRVLDAGHYVQFDRPDLVIAAVREVVDSVRARAAASH